MTQEARCLLVRVAGPQFVAGLLMDERNICVNAAPVLRHCIGRNREDLREWFQSRAWKATVVRLAVPDMAALCLEHPLVQEILLAWPDATIAQSPPAEMVETAEEDGAINPGIETTYQCVV